MSNELLQGPNHLMKNNNHCGSEKQWLTVNDSNVSAKQ